MNWFARPVNILHLFGDGSKNSLKHPGYNGMVQWLWMLQMSPWGSSRMASPMTTKSLYFQLQAAMLLRTIVLLTPALSLYYQIRLGYILHFNALDYVM